MSKIIELLPTKLIGVLIPKDAAEIRIIFHLIWYNLKDRTKQTKFGKFEYYE